MSYFRERMQRMCQSGRKSGLFESGTPTANSVTIRSGGSPSVGETGVEPGVWSARKDVSIETTAQRLGCYLKFQAGFEAKQRTDLAVGVGIVGRTPF
jgi:hypothetical protein